MVTIYDVYDDLRAVDLLPGPKVPTRSTSTISYGSHREIDNRTSETVSSFL